MGADFAATAALISNPARAAMLDCLLKGEAMSASELSKSAGVAPSTGSEHLGALLAGGLVRVEANGRHRYFSLAGPPVAEAIEALALICSPSPVGSLRQALAVDRLRFARSCYDHLAGVLGVAVLDALRSRGWLELHERDCSLTSIGEHGLIRLGVDVDGARRSRRAFGRLCLDWTERRHHLAGALGANLMRMMMHRGWLRRPGNGRAFELSRSGVSGLVKLGLPDTILGTDSRR
jgi:DNA-binding transcriptional ArsR family regulator